VILKGSQRAGAKALSAHLMNDRDNDHVILFDLRGFVADDLHGALSEAQAIASGTQCKQYMFSLSLNPPKDAIVGEADFERAADEAEKCLGLTGQPRAVVIHEKEGRRHAHVVWSPQMRAINMAHFKNKLTALSRELYLEHGWALPEGLRAHGGKSPLNFDLAQWQQAKRLGLDPREIKDVFRKAWLHSDSAKAFASALAERGFFLARGDRRGFVAIDVEGSIFAVAKYANLKTKDVAAKLGDPNSYAPVADVQREIAGKASDKLKAFISEARARHVRELAPLNAQREAMRDVHRSERTRLALSQAQRWEAETSARAQRLRTGLAGLWDTLTGKAKAIKSQNEAEALHALRRDSAQRDTLITAQLSERQSVQRGIQAMRQRHIQNRKILSRQVVALMRRAQRTQDASETKQPQGDPAPDRTRGPSFDF
jgi:hypothetical protein